MTKCKILIFYTILFALKIAFLDQIYRRCDLNRLYKFSEIPIDKGKYQGDNEPIL